MAKKLQERVDLVNDPQDIMQDLDFENFSIWHLDESLKVLMDRLQFKLPDKLIVPVTYFVISNFVASSIDILDDTIKFEYDPRSLGLMSEHVRSLLSDIQHPET